MIGLDTIITILGEVFLGGNTAMAGVLVLICTLAFVMIMVKKTLVTMALAVPLIMMFAVMGYLPSEIGIMMLVVVALGIGLESRGVFS